MNISKNYIKKCEEFIDLWSEDYIFRVGSLFLRKATGNIFPIAWSGEWPNKPAFLIPIWQIDQLFEIIATYLDHKKFVMQIIYEANNVTLELRDKSKVYLNVTGDSLEEALIDMVNLVKDVQK